MKSQTGMINMLVKIHEIVKASQPSTEAEWTTIGSEEDLKAFDASLCEESSRKKLVSSVKFFRSSDSRDFLIASFLDNTFYSNHNNSNIF